MAEMITAQPSVPPPLFDLGHRGDFDYTLIDKMLAMTPTERLHHHERWRGLLRRGRMLPNFVEEIVARLQDAGVEFLVVGGVSAILQGATFTTMDLDLCYRRTPANISRLVQALAPLHPRPRGFPPDLPFAFDERTVQLGSNFTLEVGPESLDLLGEMSAVGGYEQVIGQAADVTVGSRSAKALSLEDLIATKTAAGRKKDLAALPELRATLERKRQQGSPPP
jgi:predicted nucleotidyltransferase